MGQQTPGREPSDAGAQPRRPLSAEELRRQTEERFSALSAAATEDAAVHELRVHQIELEMQNDALARAQYETEEQRAKYFELFDLASVGQLVLTDEGLVRDANLTAARALNV